MATGFILYAYVYPYGSNAESYIKEKLSNYCGFRVFPRDNHVSTDYRYVVSWTARLGALVAPT